MNTMNRYARVALSVGALALLTVAATPAAASAGAKTVLASQSSGGQKGNQESNEPSASRTGRYIAFNSDASNLVPGDTNGLADCFVRDRVTGETERISVPDGGAGQSNGTCYGPAIDANGRYVAFESNATNLGGSANGQWQIYLHDRVDDTTVLVSERFGGGNGGNGRSGDPDISGNGQIVVFESLADNLVPNDSNGVSDVFIWNRSTGSMNRASIRTGGAQGNGGSFDPEIAAFGKFIVFDSNARNLVGNDRNGKRDVFIHNRISRKTWIVSINSKEKRGNGISSNASVSADGRFVAFQSRASNMTGADKSKNLDVFVRDRKKGTTVQASLDSRGRQGAGWSGDPSISDSGRYIAFESTAGNLVGKDPNKKRDVFLRDRIKKNTKIVSRRANGQPAWGNSDDPSISADGRFVAFESEAKKIVLKDQDSKEDLFVRGPLR